MAFNPDAFIAKNKSFNPDAFIAKNKPQPKVETIPTKQEAMTLPPPQRSVMSAVTNPVIQSKVQNQEPETELTDFKAIEDKITTNGYEDLTPDEQITYLENRPQLPNVQPDYPDEVNNSAKSTAQPTLKETPGVSKPMPNPMLPMGGGSFAVSPERLAAKTWLDDLKVPGSETLKGIKGGSYSVASGAVNNSYQMGKMSLGAVPGTAMPMIPNLETRNKIEQGYKNAPSSPLAKELYEKSKQYAQTEGTGWKGFVGQAVGNAIPYMAASVAGGVVNPAAPFMVGFAVEGNEAYFEAIDSGASEEEARLNQVIVGTANAAIEQLQVGGIFKFAKNGKQVTKELVDAVKDKAFKKLAKTGGRLSLDTIKNATTEGLEEALQETTSVLAANRVGADISGEEAAKRIGSSALGGSVVGGIMGVGGRIINNTGTKNTDVARNKPTTPIKDQVFGKGLGIGENPPTQSTPAVTTPEVKGNEVGTGNDAIQGNVEGSGVNSDKVDVTDIVNASTYNLESDVKLKLADTVDQLNSKDRTVIYRTLMASGLDSDMSSTNRLVDAIQQGRSKDIAAQLRTNVERDNLSNTPEVQRERKIKLLNSTRTILTQKLDKIPTTKKVKNRYGMADDVVDRTQREIEEDRSRILKQIDEIDVKLNNFKIDNVDKTQKRNYEQGDMSKVATNIVPNPVDMAKKSENVDISNKPGTISPVQENEVARDNIAPQDTTEAGGQKPTSLKEEYKIQEIPIKALKLSKDVPNFKEGADIDTGVVKGEELQGSYDRLGSGPIIVWKRKNGILEVITGRHRLDLAKRSGEKTIPAQVVKESDGFTRAMALTIDAESNIRDGQGKVKDYAHYFKNTETTKEIARQRGLLSRAKGKIGFVIGRSSVDDVYTGFVSGKLSEAKAYAIANGAPNNESAQMAALAKADSKSADELEQYARILSRYQPSDNQKATQGNLFGFDDSALIEADLVAKEVQKETQDIKNRILAVKGALRRPETAKDMGLEFTNEKSIRQEVERLEDRLDELSRVATTPELFDEMRKRAGLEVKSTRQKDLLGREELEGGASGKQGSFLDAEDYKTLKAKEQVNAQDDIDGQGSFLGDPIVGSTNAIDSGRIKVDMKPKGKPQTAREIVDYVGRAFNIPIRGKATHTRLARRALGWFDTKHTGIRLVDVRSLTTAMHEIGHHIDYTLSGRISKTPPTSAIGVELTKLGKALYGNKKAAGGYKSEGFAEYIRKYLTDDSPDSTPALYKWFTETYLAEHPDISSKLAKTKTMIDKWRMQGAEARVDSQISTKKIKGSLSERIEKGMLWLDTTQRDELAPIRTAMKNAGISKDELSPSDDPYQIAVARADTAGAIAEHFVLEYTTDLAGNRTGKGLREVLAPVSKDIKNFTRWIVAARARLLLKKGVNPGISQADADYVYEKYDNQQWQDTLQEITDWNHRLIDYLVEAGGMSTESAQLIKDTNPIYIPFMRAFKEGEIRGGGVGKSIAKAGKAVKKIKGSGREIIDPIESMIKQCEKIISTAHKAEVAHALARLADKKGTASMIWKVPAPQQATRFEAEQLKKDIAKIAYDRMGLDPELVSSSMLEHWDEVLTVYSNASQYYGKDNIVALVVDGKQQFYEVDPALYEAIEGLDQYTLPWVLDVVLGKPNRMVRLGATGLNASFGLIRNFIRDAATFTVLSKHAKAGPLSAIKGVVEDIIDTPNAQRFKAVGGKMASQVLADRKAAQHLKKRVLKNTISGEVFYTVAHPIDALRELFGVTEAGTRIGEFGPALKYGEKKWGKNSKAAMLYALNQSKDVTTNFSRHGKMAKVLNQIIPFYNAAIQGPDKIVRTFKERPFATTVKAIAALTIPAIWAWWDSKDEDWYKNMPVYERVNYLHFKIPGTDKIIRIPVPFELGHIFMSAPVAALDAQYRKDPKIVTEMFEESLKQADPFDWPAAVSPVIDILKNEDFAGRPIVSKASEYKLPEDQYGNYTTDLMKIIGQQLKVSPAQLEHIVNGYSGGLYQRVSKTVDLATQEEITASDLPILGTLFLKEPYAPKAQLERFYDRRDILNQKYASDNISSTEIKERSILNKRSKKLSEQWKKLPEAANATERKNIHLEMTKILTGE